MTHPVPHVGTPHIVAPASNHDAWCAVLHDAEDIRMSTEQIANELATQNAKNDGAHALIQLQLDGMSGTLNDIKGLLEKQNGRVRKNEIDISRLNLVVFSIGGTLAMTGIGVAIKFFGG